ncbi:MAG: zeta toxin family protein [Thermoleophilaceae bacterium]|nr:zeta toxin family protein [Thermoleophilaceae bacterium]
MTPNRGKSGEASGSDESVIVVKNDSRFPYSKGLMATSLMASGLPPDRSYELATMLEQQLRERGDHYIGTNELNQLAEAILAREENDVAVRNFRRWRQLDRLQRPLIILICGATGAGKSTLATMLAHRLGITRVTATDMVREVLRAFFSTGFMPSVHHSSFDADHGLRFDTTSADPFLAGFERQTEQVAVGIKALIRRAALERTSMVIEGVHALPGAFDELDEVDAVIIPLVVTVAGEELHRSHFLARGGSGARQTDRYLEAFPRIRKLQDYIVRQAASAGVPVIDNSSLDAALAEVMNLVLNRVGMEFEQTPETYGKERTQ